MLWPAGPECPHCQSTGERIRKLKGTSTRRGTYKCYGCRRPFTVKVGTVFESSHLDLRLWLQAIYLVAFATGRLKEPYLPKMVTVRRLQETLGVARKTAWIVSRRIRELIKRDDTPSVVAGETSDAGPANTSASDRTAMAGLDRNNPTCARTRSGSSPPRQPAEVSRSKSKAQRESGKPYSKRRQSKPDPRQLKLL